MIIPCGHRILVKQDNFEEQDEVFRSAAAAGIQFVKDKNVRYQESVDVGTIVSIGTTAWKDFGEVWAGVGDRIYFAKHSGKQVQDPSDVNSHYVILNDEDVVAIIKE